MAWGSDIKRQNDSFGALGSVLLISFLLIYLILAGKGRMRPILMTTLSMVIGMMPIGMASGTASEWKNGLAWVIIGGLLSSLVLTVFLVPMIYYLVDTAKEKFGR